MDFYHPLINDSKKLSEKQRAVLAPIIKKAAIAWAIGSQTPAQIDEINILSRSLYSFSQSKINLNYDGDSCFEFDLLVDLLSNFA